MTGLRREIDGYYHAVTVAELKRTLEGLTDTDLLVPNQVYNLSVLRRQPSGDLRGIGYIDLGSMAHLVDGAL